MREGLLWQTLDDVARASSLERAGNPLDGHVALENAVDFGPWRASDGLTEVASHPVYMAPEARRSTAARTVGKSPLIRSSRGRRPPSERFLPWSQICTPSSS